MSIDVGMAEIAALFIEECQEGLETMESGLMKLEPGAAEPETMNAIFRAAHSIKGGGATFGFSEISDFAHHAETLLDEMRTGQRQVTRKGVDLLLLSTDCIKAMVESLGDEGPIDTTRADELTVDLKAMIASDEGKGEAPASSESSESIVNGVLVTGYKIHFQPHTTIFASCNDPILMFRELKALGELEVCSEGHEKLDFEQIDPEECHLSWQLSLELSKPGSVSLEQIKEIFAWVEDECQLDIESISADGPIEEIKTDPLPETSDIEVAAEMEMPTKVITNAPAKEPAKPSSKSKDSGNIRVSVDKIDALINLVGELVITQSMLSRYSGDVDGVKLDEDLREGLAQLARNTRDMQESVMAIRLQPIASTFNRFTRLVRDTSNALGKKIDLELIGEGTELDKTVLERIADPLVHLVRNSLDHGLETPDVRVAAGKPETGKLILNAYHKGGVVIIEVTDDGGGINQPKVLAKAREKGIIDKGVELTPDQINDLIFAPGFSTADVVSDLSGRGVGMDVVRRNIAELGGEVSVVSQMGEGSTFTIRLPLTLAIVDGQLVRVGSECYIVPLVSIIETVQPKPEDVNAIPGHTELFKQRGEYVPILRVHKLFDIEADNTCIDDGLLVVAESNGERVGLFVDDLLDQQQVVIKSLETNYQQIPGISGATILGDGDVALILDVPGLIRLYYDQNRDVQHTVRRGRAAWNK